MAYTLNDYLMFVGVAVFIILIVWDMKVAYHRAHWFPGNGMILCGLILQSVAYLDVQNVSISGKQKREKLSSSIQNQLFIDASRLILYVFMGYLLPYMASKRNWLYIAAATASISIHIATEFCISTVFYATDMSPSANQVIRSHNGVWFIASEPVWLVLMLGFGILLYLALSYDRFVRDSFSEMIPGVLPHIENEGRSWGICKDEMLKTWVVCRVCQPEYALVRSPFSAGVGVTTTVCVAFFGVKLLSLESLLHDRLPLITLQCVFILIGWIVILYRWFKPLFRFELFPKIVLDHIVSGSFWKRYDNLFNVFMSVSFAHLGPRFLAYPVSAMTDVIVQTSTKIRSLTESTCFGDTKKWKMPVIVHKIIFNVAFIPAFVILIFLWLLWCLLIFIFVLSLSCMWCLSVLCWIVLGLILSYTYRIFKKKQVFELEKEDNFLKYKTALEELCMPGEQAASLWIDNRRSFSQLKEAMEKVYPEGTNSVELIELMRRYLSSYQPGEYLKRLEEFQVGRMKKYFPSIKEPLWRMTALVLLEIIEEVGLSSAPASGVDYTSRMKLAWSAYKQAERMLNFVDCPDNVDMKVDIFGGSSVQVLLLTFTANILKRDLERRYSSLEKSRPRQNSRDMGSVEAMVQYIQDSFDEAKNTLTNWKLVPKKSSVLTAGEAQAEGSVVARSAHLGAVGLYYCRYKVCGIILEEVYNNREELMDRVLIIFEDVMVGCISSPELPELLLKSCRDWAKEFNEEKIRQAIDIAGLAFGVLDAAETDRTEAV